MSLLLTRTKKMAFFSKNKRGFATDVQCIRLRVDGLVTPFPLSTTPPRAMGGVGLITLKRQRRGSWSYLRHMT